MRDNTQRDKVLALVRILMQYIADEIDLSDNDKVLISDLLDAGFEGDDIQSAISMLSSMTPASDTETDQYQMSIPPVRIYTFEERHVLSSDARGLLYRLRTLGIINDRIQEEIIDKALSIAEGEIPMHEMRMITAITILTESDRDWQREVGCIIEDNWSGVFH